MTVRGGFDVDLDLAEVFGSYDSLSLIEAVAVACCTRSNAEFKDGFVIFFDVDNFNNGIVVAAVYDSKAVEVEVVDSAGLTVNQKLPRVALPSALRATINSGTSMVSAVMALQSMSSLSEL